MSDWPTELYAGEFDDFIPRRAALAKRAKDAGETDLAKQVLACRKPTRAAWLVNLLAVAEPEQLAEALELGEALAQAHREASGSQLRELSAARTRTVNALARRAGELGSEHDYQAPASAIGEVAETIQAALADPELARGIRTGTMTASVRAAGFGPVDLFAPVSASAPNVIDLASRRKSRAAGKKIPGGAGSDSPAPDKGLDPAGIRAAERALTRAEMALEQSAPAHRRLESDLSAARRARKAADAEFDAAEREVERLRESLREAEDRLADATDEATNARERAEESAAALAESARSIADLEEAMAQAREDLRSMGIDP